MLHVTTEIGVPGKAERERKHFPQFFNLPSEPVYPRRGRRFIPHGQGKEEEFKPHAQLLRPEYTENGPDWQSRLRWIPSPNPENYKPEPEIWPEPWKPLRTFPWMSQRTADEWIMYPETDDVALRCKWNDNHKASNTSDKEFTHTMLYGKGRKLFDIDRRNGVGLASPGDKSYQAVEYSQGFHKEGSTRPVVNFGDNMVNKHDTFVPLNDMPRIPRESFVVRDKRRKEEEEVRDVQNLEYWRPATPLVPQVQSDDKHHHHHN